MKRLFTSISLSVFCVLLVFGQEVDEKTAQIVAERFYYETYGTRKSVENIQVKTYNGHNSYYVNNMEDNGWVIVPANQNLNPAIAYSDEGYVDLTDAPDVFLDWFEQYEFVVDYAIKEKWEKKDKFEKWNRLLKNAEENVPILKTYIDHTFLVSSKWKQSVTNDFYSNGYNYLMPSNSSCSSGKCPAGCVAVAIGQIMYYWGYSRGNNAGFDWWNMPDELMHSSQNYNAERLAVSYLLKRIGDEIDMNYCKNDECSSEADTKDADDVFIPFGYKNNMEYKRKALNTYNGWVDILKTEIQAERPILYRYIGKHAFVCDGYTSNGDNFHFNLGWGQGSSNANTYWTDFEDIEDIPGCEEYIHKYNHACWIKIRPNLSVSQTISSLNANYDNTTYQTKSSIEVTASCMTNTDTEFRFVAGDSIVLKPGCNIGNGNEMLCKIFRKPTLKNQSIEVQEPSIVTEEVKNNARYEIFPNPTDGFLHIRVAYDDIQENDMMTVYVYSMQGIKIKEESFVPQEDNQIDLSLLPPDNYVITVMFRNSKYSKTIIKF